MKSFSSGIPFSPEGIRNETWFYHLWDAHYKKQIPIRAGEIQCPPLHPHDVATASPLQQPVLILCL